MVRRLISHVKMSTTTAIPGVAPSLLAEPDLCTLQTCPLVLAHVQYVPSLAGNALYLSIFGLALVIQIGLGYYYRTWGYLAAMFDGIVLEILGYVARVQMHYNPFSRSPFLMYASVLPATQDSFANLFAGILSVSLLGQHSSLQPSTYACRGSLWYTQSKSPFSNLGHIPCSLLHSTSSLSCYRLQEAELHQAQTTAHRWTRWAKTSW